jgi:hypothetical protein
MKTVYRLDHQIEGVGLSRADHVDDLGDALVQTDVGGRDLDIVRRR